MTQDVHFSLLTHSKQLLLLTFCDTAAETEVSVRTHERKRNGWTDKRGSQNSYLDDSFESWKVSKNEFCHAKSFYAWKLLDMYVFMVKVQIIY